MNSKTQSLPNSNSTYVSVNSLVAGETSQFTATSPGHTPNHFQLIHTSNLPDSTDFVLCRHTAIDAPGVLERLTEAREEIQARLPGSGVVFSTRIAQSHEEGEAVMTCLELTALFPKTVSLKSIADLGDSMCDFVAESPEPSVRSLLVIRVGWK